MSRKRPFSPRDYVCGEEGCAYATPRLGDLKRHRVRRGHREKLPASAAAPVDESSSVIEDDFPRASADEGFGEGSVDEDELIEAFLLSGE